ncbi:MAG: nucleotide exchange factor GrpE, partial [Candidatus Moranbacteria bacterium]|nr:nucleotide exchange factor GrpE [Candidatus Moranbacteria bacterium]
MTPQHKDANDFQQKLWDHLHIIGNFELDVDAPYPVPKPEILHAKPQIVPYATGKIRYAHYGKHTQAIIDKVSEMEEGEDKDILTRIITNHLKKSYLTWNRESVNDDLILDHLRELSGGRLQMKDESQIKDGQKEELVENIIPVAVGIILNKEGKIFLAQGKKYKNAYILPGGKIEKGESMEDALEREIFEETGMRGEIQKNLSFDQIIFEGKRYLLCNFIFSWEGADEEIVLNGEYSGKYNWYSVDEALELTLGGNAPVALNAYKEYIEKKESLNGWRRCLADFENYKKRQEFFGRSLADQALENTAISLLPVIDNFASATSHIPQGQESDSWVTGIMYIQKQLETVLQEMDIKEILAKEGDIFDPSFHEAIEDTNKEEKDVSEKEQKESIKKIIQKGYIFREKVIRPTRVIVG